MKAGIPYWQSDEKEGVRLDLRGMSDLIAITKNVRFKIKKEGTAELAELLAQAIAHPDTPARLYNAITTYVCEGFSTEVSDSPEFIKLLLDHELKE
jgi:hypothetical protein